MKPDFKAVIFDFDGVVVDSLRFHLDAWRLATLEIFGKSIEEFEKGLAGRATMAIAQIICDEMSSRYKLPISTKQVVELADLKKQILRELRTPIALVHGIREFCAELKSRKIPFGIGSNAPRQFIQNTLARHDFEFEHFFGFEDAERPKPAPDLFLKMADLLGVRHPDHRKVLVFEDSTHGVTAAVAAGMSPVGVCTQHDPEILIKAGCYETVYNHVESCEKFL